MVRLAVALPEAEAAAAAARAARATAAEAEAAAEAATNRHARAVEMLATIDRERQQTEAEEASAAQGREATAAFAAAARAGVAEAARECHGWCERHQQTLTAVCGGPHGGGGGGRHGRAAAARGAGAARSELHELEAAAAVATTAAEAAAVAAETALVPAEGADVRRYFPVPYVYIRDPIECGRDEHLGSSQHDNTYGASLPDDAHQTTSRQLPGCHQVLIQPAWGTCAVCRYTPPAMLDTAAALDAEGVRLLGERAAAVAAAVTTLREYATAMAVLTPGGVAYVQTTAHYRWAAALDVVGSNPTAAVIERQLAAAREAAPRGEVRTERDPHAKNTPRGDA